MNQFKQKQIFFIYTRIFPLVFTRFLSFSCSLHCILQHFSIYAYSRSIDIHSNQIIIGCSRAVSQYTALFGQKKWPPPSYNVLLIPDSLTYCLTITKKELSFQTMRNMGKIWNCRLYDDDARYILIETRGSCCKSLVDCKYTAFFDDAIGSC